MPGATCTQTFGNSGSRGGQQPTVTFGGLTRLLRKRRDCGARHDREEGEASSGCLSPPSECPTRSVRVRVASMPDRSKTRSWAHERDTTGSHNDHD
jgi:hypothetical protein